MALIDTTTGRIVDAPTPEPGRGGFLGEDPAAFPERFSGAPPPTDETPDAIMAAFRSGRITYGEALSRMARRFAKQNPTFSEERVARAALEFLNVNGITAPDAAGEARPAAPVTPEERATPTAADIPPGVGVGTPSGGFLGEDPAAGVSPEDLGPGGLPIGDDPFGFQRPEFGDPGFELTQREDIDRALLGAFGDVFNPATRRALQRTTQFLPDIFGLRGAQPGADLSQNFFDFVQGQIGGGSPTGGDIRSQLMSLIGGGEGLSQELLTNPNASTQSGFFGPTITASALPQILDAAPAFRNAILQRAKRTGRNLLLQNPGQFQTPQDLLGALQPGGLF